VAREVNIYTSGWKATGAKVAVPQYEQRIRVAWVDDNGGKHTAEETLLFPDVMTALDAVDVREVVEGIMLRELRARQKVDAPTAAAVEA